LGEEEGLSLGWIFKAHPAFGFRDDIKERLIAMMTKDYKEIKLAIFPKNIKYKRVKDGNVMPNTGVTLQIAKSEGITATEFRANMVGKWWENGSNLIPKQADLSLARSSSHLANRETSVMPS
jgi:hypothetical protein